MLESEGYIKSITEEKDGNGFPSLKLKLKYYQGNPVIEMIKRVSKPGCRVYTGKDDIPAVKKGLGITIVSTSKGIMTDRNARKAGVGGEVICYVA